MSQHQTITQTSKEGLIYDRTQKKYVFLFISGIILLAVLIFLSLTTGRYPTLPQEVIRSILDHGSNVDVYNIVKNSRAPRLIAAMLIGAALSVSGYVFQSLFANNMASPDILGVSSGAGLGASMAIVWGFGYGSIFLFSFFGGILSVSSTIAVSRIFRKDAGNSIPLILSGIIIGGFMNSAIGLFKYLANDTQLNSITYWLLGGLMNINHNQLNIVGPIIGIGIISLCLLRWKIIILKNNVEDAQIHGVNAEKTKYICIFLATLITAASVSVGGTIGWIGLAIPNMVKVVLKDDNKYAMSLDILYGASFTVLSDLLARTLSNSEIPIGIITGMLGALIFILVLAVRRKYYE